MKPYEARKNTGPRLLGPAFFVMFQDISEHDVAQAFLHAHL